MIWGCLCKCSCDGILCFKFKILYSSPKRFSHDGLMSLNRWSRHITSTHGNIFLLKKLIIPVNIQSKHWCCCVAHILEKRIQYYDSSGGEGHVYLSGLKVFHISFRGSPFLSDTVIIHSKQEYLKEEAKKHLDTADGTPNEHLLDIDTWELVPTQVFYFFSLYFIDI